MSRRLGDLPCKRVECEGEWREAWCLPPGDNHVLELGSPQPETILRLGIMGAGQDGGRIHVRVYVGDRLVARLNATNRMRWADYRIDLSRPATVGELCRVVLSAPSSVYLAPCELISPGAEVPNVLIFLVDSLRLDHLGCYGYGRETSPNTDELAQDGITFTQLMPQCSWTRPSVGSLLTGTYPNVHGACREWDALRKDLPTLGKALEDAGYETHGFMTNPYCVPLWGFGNEFFRYLDVDSARWEVCDDAKVVDAVIDTLYFVAGRPWFFFIHTMGPHTPYDPPKPYDKRFQPERYQGSETEIAREKTVDLYDGEISYTDVQFGRLVRELKGLGLYDNAVVLFLSDHGEEFWDHGKLGHGKSLFEEVLRIPLLIKMPGGAYAAEIREGLVESVDIGPTILEMVGAAPEPRFQGRSFLDLIRTGQAQERAGYAFLDLSDASVRTAKTVRTKYIHDLAAPDKVWFDLVNDPREVLPRRGSPPGGDVLVRHVARMAMRGAAGLHLLVTEGPDAHHAITGTITAAGADTFDVSYYEWKSDVRKVGNTVSFQMETRDDTADVNLTGLWQESFLEEHYARLHIDVGPDTDLVVDIRVEDRPAAESDVFVGRAKTHRSLDGARLRPLEIVGSPDAFSPSALPKRFAIYLWYVPPPEVLSEEDLDPQLKEALQALGYLD